jgi:hypothetical protein
MSRMTFSIHTALLWFVGFLYTAFIVGMCAVFTFLVLTERAGATRHTRAANEAQAGQRKETAQQQPLER